MNKLLFVSSSLDDTITSKFNSLDYLEIFNFPQFYEDLSRTEVTEPIRLGFVLDCNNKGLDNDIINFITELIPIFNERIFEYLFVMGVGKYSRFNVSALEGILMYYSANASYTGIVKNDKNIDFSNFVNDINDCKIKLIWKAFGVNFYIPKIVKKIDNWILQKNK